MHAYAFILSIFLLYFVLNYYASPERIVYVSVPAEIDEREYMIREFIAQVRYLEDRFAEKLNAQEIISISAPFS